MADISEATAGGSRKDGEGVEEEVAFGDECLAAFSKRFVREMPQEMGEDIRNTRYDGSFMKVIYLELRFHFIYYRYYRKKY